MARGRAGTVVLSVLVLTLFAAGLSKHQSLGDERDAADRDTTRARRELTRDRTEMLALRASAGALETENATTRRRTDELIGVAATTAARIAEVQRERDDAALAAWLAGGQVSAMRECLAGVNRALNQVSVGDPGSVATLETVRSQCRSVGA